MVITAILGAFVLFAGSLYAADTRDTRFHSKFPDNWKLLKGDIIKMPISDYVQFKGSSFTTNLNDPKSIVPSIAFKTDVSVDPLANRCDLLKSHGNNQLLMVCNGRYFVKAVMDHFSYRTESFTYVELASTIPTENQECSDMFIQNGFAYVACSDRNVKYNRDIFIYTVNIDSKALASTKCKSNLQGGAKMSFANYDAGGKYQVILHDIVPGDAASGTINFTRCTIQETGVNTISASTLMNLAELIPDASLSATIRGVVSLVLDEILFVLAEVNPTTLMKQSRFAIVSVAADGSMAKSKFKLATFLPGSLRNTYDPRRFATSFVVNPSNTLIFMVGLTMNYRLTMTFDRTTNPNEYLMNIAQPAMSTLDCGFNGKADIYIGRVTTVVPPDGIDSDSFRQIIEYRSTSSSQLKGFAIRFSYSNYGCSFASGASSAKSFYGVTLNGDEQAIASSDDKTVSYFKINRDTMLVIDTSKLSEGKNEIDISANLGGFNKISQPLTFELFGDYRDQVEISLQTKELDVYSNSTFGLPYISSNFIGNNLEFKTNMPNIVMHYSKTFTPALGLELTDGYSIERVFAVDHDTFVAVLSKKGFVSKYISYFGKISGDEMTLQISSTTPTQKQGQALFKIFKLGDGLYCMVFKGFSSDVKKLTMSCFEDKPEGATKLNDHVITDMYEVMDIQFLETRERVDFLMVAGVVEQNKYINKIIHFFVKVEADGSVVPASSAKQVDILNSALNKYNPVDALFDYVADLEGSNHVTIKMNSEQSTPIIAKFNMSFEGDAVHLKYLRSMQLEHNDVAYCVNRNEAILFNRKTRQLYAQRFDRNVGIPSLNQYQFPLTSLGIQYVIQFLCIPEKGIFQILGVDANKKKFLITYRGGESHINGRRLHSIVPVDASVNFIEHGYSADYVVTVAGGPGPSDLKRTYVQTYPEGPKFYVDTTGKTENFDITLTAQTEKKNKEEKVSIRLVQPYYTPVPAAKKQFEIKAGAIVFLDDVASISGPVLDVQLMGNPEDLKDISLVKRNNKYKGLNIGDSEQPDKVITKGDFIIVIKYRKYVKFYGDPTIVQENAKLPITVFSHTGNYRDIATVKLGLSEDVAVITKEFTNSEFVYTLHILRKLKDINGRDAFIRDSTKRLWSTKDDFEDIQLTNKEDDIIMALRAKRELISNYIRLLAIKKDTQGYSVTAVTNLIPQVERLIQTYSLFYIGSNTVAVLTCSDGIIGVQSAIWDTYAKQLVLVDTPVNLQIDEKNSRKINVDYLRCWNNYGNAVVQCVFDAEGVTDFLVEVTMNPLFPIEGNDCITSMKVLKSFEMPPMFGIKRVSRSENFFTFLVEKNQAAKTFSKRRMLEETQKNFIDKYTDCNNLILSYNPFASPFVFTGITCSEWNNSPSIDMSFENIGGRAYIFYTKPGPADPTKALETANDRVGSNFVSGIVLSFNSSNIDATKVKLNFVGLNGQNSDQNKQLSLEEFKQGAPDVNQQSKSRTWLWIIVILIILLVVGGVVYLYMKRQASGSSKSENYSAYKDGVGNDKDDLEDIRL